MQSFMPIHFFVFKIRTIENGFPDPKRFRDFRETGPKIELTYQTLNSKNDDLSFEVFFLFFSFDRGQVQTGLFFDLLDRDGAPYLTPRIQKLQQ